MKRRTLLAAAASLPIASRTSAAQDTKTLRFVPQADLRVLDPIWTTAYVTRNFAYMVYDTLLGTDAQQRIQPQMVQGWAILDAGLTYRFHLRPGLAFHDGQKVRGVDCVVSLQRWGARDQAGQRLFAVLSSIEAEGDDAFVIRLVRPFPQLLVCLAKIAGNPFIMPERLARTDPGKQVTEVVGSGPFTFAADQWVPGQRAVFLRNPRYVPRDEPPSGSAGGKVAYLDRIEWLVLSDPATIAAAMASGEIDWWGYPTPDLVPLLRKTRGVTVKPSDPGGNIGIMRFNHVQPPFDKLAVRQAVAMAIDRSEYLQVMGGEKEFWVECDSSFPCDPASAPPRKPDIEGARRLLRSSGYAGEPAVVLSAADQTIVQLQASVTADVLQRIGMVVDLQDMDSAGILARRLSHAPVSKGGWSIFHTWFDASNLRDPAVNPTLSANGDKGWFGWPTDPETEALIAAWFDAPDNAAAAGGIRALDHRLSETVPFLITGQFRAPTATRSTVTGVLDAPALFFWNVRKA